MPGWGKLLDFTIIGVKMDVLDSANIPDGTPSPLPMTDCQKISKPKVKDLITVVHYPKDPPGFQRCTNPERILTIAGACVGSHMHSARFHISCCPCVLGYQTLFRVQRVHLHGIDSWLIALILYRSNVWPQCYNIWRLLWVSHF